MSFPVKDVKRYLKTGTGTDRRNRKPQLCPTSGTTFFKGHVQVSIMSQRYTEGCPKSKASLIAAHKCIVSDRTYSVERAGIKPKTKPKDPAYLGADSEFEHSL